MVQNCQDSCQRLPNAAHFHTNIVRLPSYDDIFQEDPGEVGWGCQDQLRAWCRGDAGVQGKVHLSGGLVGLRHHGACFSAWESLSSALRSSAGGQGGSWGRQLSCCGQVGTKAMGCLGRQAHSSAQGVMAAGVLKRLCPSPGCFKQDWALEAPVVGLLVWPSARLRLADLEQSQAIHLLVQQFPHLWEAGSALTFAVVSHRGS